LPMAMQSFLTPILILLSVFLLAQAIHYRFSGYVGWAIANAVVVLCGVLALWFSQDWAGWLTGMLFVLLVACPTAFSLQAARATQRGDLERAAQLLRWGVLRGRQGHAAPPHPRLSLGRPDAHDRH
jgi:cobalamin biosynthesis protein CobD/CbiB